MKLASAVILIGLGACGGAASEPTTESASIGAPAAPSWCAPLEPVQVSCAIDPLVACEERSGHKPASAHACGTYASTPCVGFDTGCAGVFAYCCESPAWDVGPLPREPADAAAPSVEAPSTGGPVNVAAPAGMTPTPFIPSPGVSHVLGDD